MKLQLSSIFATAVVLSTVSAASHAVVVFDNISAFEAATPGALANVTSSTPNTFMGGAYTLSAGTTSITGFDLFPYNGTSVTYNALKFNVYVWGTVNGGVGSVATPAFSNLLGNYSFTSTGSYVSGSFYLFETATPGVTPAFTVTTPLAITGTTVGITFNFQGSTDGGLTYASANGLDSVITNGVAPTVGSLPYNGYYRNAAGETNGNFTSGVRTLTGLTNQGLAVRVYGNVSAVPEPGTWAMMVLGMVGIGFVARRRA